MKNYTLLIFLFVLEFLQPQNVNAQKIILTIAGNGIQSYSGDGGPARNASLDLPQGIAVDNAGNVYFADQNNHEIRKIDTSGNINAIAGGGFTGLGDNGPATSAELNLPTDVVLDNVGNLFIADRNNNRIRRVDHSTNIITTIAGTGTAGYSGDSGLAVSAKLFNPFSLCLDKAGNILFSDNGNNVIRKITVSTGIITTIAGNGTAGFSGDFGPAINAKLDGPQGICVDTAGNIYFADNNNNCVRQVNITTGNIKTFAGTTIRGYSGDSVLAGGAKLSAPEDVYIDALNQGCYIADWGNQRIRRVDMVTDIITTVVGNGYTNLSGMGGFAGDSSDATKAELNAPSGVTVDKAGNIFLSDQFNFRIRKTAAPLAIKQINAIPFSISPNPSSGIVYANIPKAMQNYQIEVHDILGRMISLSQPVGQRSKIDLSNEPNGIYFIHLFSNENNFVEKIVIRK